MLGYYIVCFIVDALHNSIPSLLRFCVITDGCFYCYISSFFITCIISIFTSNLHDIHLYQVCIIVIFLVRMIVFAIFIIHILFSLFFLVLFLVLFISLQYTFVILNGICVCKYRLNLFSAEVRIHYGVQKHRIDLLFIAESNRVSDCTPCLLIPTE